jgi:hypothetical protein
MAEETPAPGVFKVSIDGGGLTMDREVDQTTALAVVNLLMGDEVPPPAAEEEEESGGAGGGGGSKPRRAKSGAKRKGKGKGRSSKSKSVGIDKNLSLRPKGKTSFKDFATEKAPSDHYEKTAVAVYWLVTEAGVAATAEAVNTCYQHVEWKRPADLRNALAQTASKKGWLDTSDKDEVKLTVPGEDYVKHDLPKPAK